MTERAKTAILWVLAILWAAFIFFMSAHTGADLDEGAGVAAMVKRWLSALAAPLVGEGVDVVSPMAHFCEYAVFGALLMAALSRSFSRRSPGRPIPPRSRWLLFALAVAIASLYGATDELHQHFVPGRLCDPVDWLVDTVGAAFGVGAVALAARADQPPSPESGHRG